MMVLTDKGMTLTGLGLAPVAPVALKPILDIFVKNLPLVLNALRTNQPARVTDSTGQRQTLTPDQIRQWLDLFCQYGLLPRENCFAAAAPPVSDRTPPESGEPWYKQIKPETWLMVGAFLLAVLVIVKMR
jgi:hypothetical protein